MSDIPNIVHLVSDVGHPNIITSESCFPDPAVAESEREVPQFRRVNERPRLLAGRSRSRPAVAGLRDLPASGGCAAPKLRGPAPGGKVQLYPPWPGVLRSTLGVIRLIRADVSGGVVWYS